MDIKAVISIKCGQNTIVWGKISHLRYFVQNLSSVKVNSDWKISEICRQFRAAKSQIDKIFGI